MAEGEQISGELVHALAKAGYEAGQASLTYPGSSWSELPTTDALVWMNAAEAIALAIAAPAVVVSAEPVARDELLQKALMALGLMLSYHGQGASDYADVAQVRAEEAYDAIDAALASTPSKGAA